MTVLAGCPKGAEDFERMEREAAAAEEKAAAEQKAAAEKKAAADRAAGVVPSAEEAVAEETTPVFDDPFDPAVAFGNDRLLTDGLTGLELPAVPDTLVEKDGFEAPATLDDLISAHQWTDNPVLDGYALLADEKPADPALPIGKAIGMRNESAAVNDELVETFGQFPASDDEVDYDATFTISWAADAKTTNPILGSSTADFELTGYTGAGLFGLSRDMESYASADSVVSWRTSDDRLVDLFVLRDDMTWSDGQPITAHDYAFTYQAILNPKVPAVAVRTGTEELVDVVAYDDVTLAFFHEAPKATNKTNMNFGVIPKHIYEESMRDDPGMRDSDRHVELEENPIIGGPYQIKRRSIDQEIVLERRESYYMHNGKQVRRKPHFKEVVVKIIVDPNTALLSLEKGDIDYLEPLTPPQWSGQTNDGDFYEQCTKLSAPQWVYFYFGWNTADPLFEDRRVRRAMSLAFDHEEFLNTVTYGLFEPGTGPFPADAWYAPEKMPRPLQQDLDAAEELLAEAGWKDTDGDGILDKDGKKFDFTMIFPSSDPNREAAAKMLKRNLELIGVRMVPKRTEFTVLMQRTRDKDFQAFAGGWGTGSDPDTSKNIWKSGEGRNYTSFSRDDVDEIFDTAIYEFDREKRGKLYGRVAEILWAEQPYTFLYFRSTFVGMSNELRGITFSPRGPLGFSGGFEGLWKPKK